MKVTIIRNSRGYNIVSYWVPELKVAFQLDTLTKKTATNKEVDLQLYKHIHNYHTTDSYPEQDTLHLKVLHERAN
jgi:hypothetical protein